jgi:hypothetical protein
MNIWGKRLSSIMVQENKASAKEITGRDETAGQ